MKVAPPYDHGLMLAIHGESHDVISGHSRQLLGNYVLQINQITHRCQRLIILDNYELDLALVFLSLDL